MYNRTTFHEICREDVGEIRDELDNLSRSVNSLTSIIANSNLCTVDTNIAGRRKKRRRFKSELADIGGHTMAVVFYDDGTYEVATIFENVRGIGEIMVMSFPEEIDIAEIADISFSSYSRHVTVTLPTNGNRLYAAFLEAGIFFNVNFAEREIPKLLERYYIPIFDKQPRQLGRILPGWDGDSYITGKAFDWFEGRVRESLKKIPLTKKFFPADIAEKEELLTYLRMLKNVKKPEMRILVLVHPVLSMLASIVQNPLPVLNFIVEGQARFALAYMMQVYERHKPKIHSVADKPSKLPTILAEVRDETVLLAADINSFMTPYEQNRMMGNVYTCTNVLGGNEILSAPYMRHVTAGGVIFSNCEMTDSRLIKVYVGVDDFEPAFFQYSTYGNNHDFPGIFFSAFSVFAEKHIIEIREMVRNADFTEAMNLYTCGFNILEQLFNEAGIDLRKNLGIHNVKSVLDKLEDQSEDDVAEIFRKIMRTAIQEIVTVEKKSADYPDERMIYYSDDFLWIPSRLLNQILTEKRLLALRNRILFKLKEMGALKTDSGFLKRVMIAKKRLESLQISRDFFTKEDEIDIIDLGLEAEDYDF